MTFPPRAPCPKSGLSLMAMFDELSSKLSDTLRRLTAVQAREEKEASARIDELTDEQLPLHRARRAVAWLTEECEGLQDSHSEAG